MVKKACGSKPAILGKKITQVYYRDARADKNYFEVDVDISSSKVAGSILRVVKGYISNLSLEFHFLLEAQEEETLPERLFGGVRLMNLDLDAMVRPYYIYRPRRLLHLPSTATIIFTVHGDYYVYTRA
jgi:hypothetical protein